MKKLNAKSNTNVKPKYVSKAERARLAALENDSAENLPSEQLIKFYNFLLKLFIKKQFTFHPWIDTLNPINQLEIS